MKGWIVRKMKREKVQDIADTLKLSRVTVWKVLNKKTGVSDDTRQRVIDYLTQPTDTMSYVQKEQDSPVIVQKQTLVSVVVSRPETSAFWVKIIHQLSEEYSNKGIGLLYTYLPDHSSEDYVLPTSLTDGTLQGIIVLNVYDKNMISKLNDLTIPKVFLDTITNMSVSNLTGDLLLLEGKSCIREITMSMIDKGKKAIGFIGDIQYAKTNMERYEGYLMAMKEKGLSVESNFCFTESMTLRKYTEMIDNFVDGLEQMPEAFVCVNDHAATLLMQSLEKRGYRIPEDIMVSGYDDNKEFTYTQNLTTVHVDNSILAKRLARQLLYRIENIDDPYEVTFIRSKVIYRSSTNY